MKKIRVFVFLTVLFASFFVFAQSAYAATITGAEYENNRISLRGTGETQVQIVLFGSDNSPLYMTTAGVTAGEFSITLPEIAGLTYGSYTVKVADYDGTDVDSKVITISAPYTPGSETVYRTTEGADGTWTQGAADGYSFTFGAPFGRFRSLRMDGVPVAAGNYDQGESSTVITLHADYLATLSVGTHTLRAIFTDGYAQTTFTIAASANPFADVAERDWFYEDVMYARANGLMKGAGYATFNPHGTATRGMIVTILYRLEGKPAVTGDCPFDDVASGKYYEDAVTWAAANKIVSGYGDGSFGADDPITRQQLAAILYRYAQYKGGGFTGAWMFRLDFPDAASVSDYAYEAMCWCTMNGIINGNGDGNLMPQRVATRCQVAAILHRFCENQEK